MKTKDFKVERSYKDNDNIYFVLSNSNLMSKEEKEEILNSSNLIISKTGISHIVKREDNI